MPTKTIHQIIELLKMEEAILNVNDIFLDPNNPRFMIDKEEITPDNRIIEDLVQKKCLIRLKDIGIRDLTESIAEIGFLKIDRIVVRPFEQQKYVVVEGNRRVASLKIVKEAYDEGELKLDREILDSIMNLNVLIYRGKDRDISWMIQGIRHISGIKDWPPYQQARFIIKLTEEQKLPIPDVAGMLGIGARAITRLQRAYYGYLQASNNIEYGAVINPSMFSFFQEAVFQKRTLMDWLNWSDNKRKFLNEDKFNKFLSFICEDDEGNKPKIERALDVRDSFSAIIGYPDILTKFEENKNYTLREAYGDVYKRIFEAQKAREDERKEKELITIRYKELNEMAEKIMNLPTVKIKTEKRDEFLKVLTKLKENIECQIGMIK
jgi:hypothetical protein